MVKPVREGVIDPADERRIDAFFTRNKDEFEGGKCGVLICSVAEKVGARNVPVLDTDAQVYWFEVINMMCTPDKRVRRKSTLALWYGHRREEVRLIAQELGKMKKSSQFDALNDWR